MAFGASLSTTTKPNTTPTHTLLLRHNNNWSNGFMQPPSVPVLALSLTQSNATSSQLGQASPPTSSDSIFPHPTPLLKATLTNNDNANANILVPMNNQSLQAAPALTPFTPPILTLRPHWPHLQRPHRPFSGPIKSQRKLHPRCIRIGQERHHRTTFTQPNSPRNQTRLPKCRRLPQCTGTPPSPTHPQQ